MDGDKKRDNQAQDDAGWQYNGGTNATDQLAPVDMSPAQSWDPQANGDSDAVEWSASEFVAHEKNFAWYALLVCGSALVAVAVYIVTRDMFSAGAVVAVAVIMAIAAARKPREVIYRVDGSGITVDNKFHPYSEYKAFAMPEEGPFSSIVLVPMKRFGFPLSAYLAPDSQEAALEVLSMHLPLERGELDSVEKLMRQLRF